MQSSMGRFWAFLAMLVLLHLILHIGLGLGRSAPDLLVAAALLASRRTDGASAAAIGVGLGLLDDALGMRGFGVRAFSIGVAAYLGARSRQVVEGDAVLFLPLVLFLGAWAAYAVAWVVDGGVDPTTLITRAPTDAAYAAATGTFAIMIYRMFVRE
jgi:rod shape-determining protein MreD